MKDNDLDLGLSNKLALIAGGSRGMGGATAEILAAEGAHVVILARDPAGMARQVEAIRASGGKADYLECDLTDTGSVEAAFASIDEEFGIPDICVVSAGDAQGGLFWEIEDETWNRALDLKFMGLVRVMRAVAPRMKAAGRGRVVAVVGNNGRQPHPRMLPGSAANAACLAIIRGLAEELAADGVSVTALNPGPTRTDRWNRLIGNLAAKEGRAAATVEKEQLGRMPKGRIGEADEMARLIAVLCSDIADMVTGTSLTADGGATRSIA